MRLRRFPFVTLSEIVLEGFFHLLRGQLVEDAHAAVIYVQKLHPLAVEVSVCIHNDFIHKLVDQLRGQCFQFRDLLHLLNEPLQALGLVRLGFQERLHLWHSSLQRFLLPLVGQGGVALVR